MQDRERQDWQDYGLLATANRRKDAKAQRNKFYSLSGSINDLNLIHLLCAFASLRLLAVVKSP